MKSLEENSDDHATVCSYKKNTQRQTQLQLYRLPNGGSFCFEVRLFYVRITPCPIDGIPNQLVLRYLPRATGVILEINGGRIPASETASLLLRRDRLDMEASEVTYVSIDSVRITGAVEFQVYEKEDLILCGTMERLDSPWGGDCVNGKDHNHHHQIQGLSNDLKTGWSMECCSAVSSTGSSSFVGLGVSSPSIEVYIAGCCSGFPLILTKTIHISSRRKAVRQGTLDSIPEDEETGREERNNSLLLHRKTLQVAEGILDGYDSEGKIGRTCYPEGGYTDDDGQLSLFNAGVRVGMGIGLGICLGIGIGVGLLMHSYQATTRTFKRRFF